MGLFMYAIYLQAISEMGLSTKDIGFFEWCQISNGEYDPLGN